MTVQTTTQDLISLRGVRKSYQQPNGQQIVILDNITLELRPGEILALLIRFREIDFNADNCWINSRN